MRAGSSDVGTLAWAERTGGRLDVADRARLVGQLLLEVPALIRDLPPRFGATPKRRLLDISTEPPRTAIADAATARCQHAAVDRRWLYVHSVRTYGFALLFARRAGLEPDLEVLWVATMLHDIALADAVVAPATEPVCFAVRGARAAAELADEHGWSAERRRRVAEAISMHINVRVSARLSLEGQLVHLGAALDVAGNGYAKVASPALDAIVEQHPYNGFHDTIRCVWKAEASRSPGSRARFLRYAGLAPLARSSPLRRR